MSTGISKEKVHILVKQLLEQGFVDIQIKEQSHDMYIITWK